MRLNTKELSKKIGIPEGTIYRKRLSGTLGIPSVKLDKLVFYEFDEKEWIKKNQKGSMRRKKLLEHSKKLREILRFIQGEIRKDYELEKRAIFPKK